MPLADAHFSNLRNVLASDAPLEGLEIADRYRVEQRIARGGMGEVFYAIDMRLDRPVALKALARRVEGEQTPERLALEVAALARLDHPGIVPIHDLGTLPDGRLFFAMKYVEGSTLRERMSELPSAACELMAALATAADTIHFAHERGVIHRDLKPANVMTDRHGHVFVLDWGVAKLAGGREGGKGAVGTAGYMAPESRSGGARIDARVDVWALGAILHEIVEGMPPSRAAEAAARVAGRAMANLPDDRHASAAAFATDLRRAIRQGPSRRLVIFAAAGTAMAAWSFWAVLFAGGRAHPRAVADPARRQDGLRRAQEVLERMRATTLQAFRARLLRLVGDTILPVGLLRADEFTRGGVGERTRALDDLRSFTDPLAVAVSAWLRGDTEDALQLLDASSFASADRLRAREWLGWVHMQLGQIDQARRCFEEGLGLAPEHVPFAHGLALAQMAQRNRATRGTAKAYERAIGTLDAALAKGTLLAKSHALRGDLLLRSRSLDPDGKRAIADFDAVLAIAESAVAWRDRGDAFSSRALVRVRQGADPRADFAAAAADYQRAREGGAVGPMILLRVAAVRLHRAEWRHARGEDVTDDYREALAAYRELGQRAPAWRGLLRPLIDTCRRHMGR